MNIAISGFGRIGRNVLRVMLQDTQFLKKHTITAINIGPADPTTIAHSFKYDTLLGTYPESVTLVKDSLVIGKQIIKIVAQKDPEQLPWKKLKIDWVIESSGKFTKKIDAQKHIKAGAKRVLISAPSSDADFTCIMGVNQDKYNPQKDHIISAGSCTTNALVPVLKVIQDTFGIESAYMTTVHAYTNNQVLLDLEGSDPRRARAAALNIIPTTTGAMKVVGTVLPELAGKIEGCSLRVPVAKVSLIDLSFIAQKQITSKTIHAALQKAAKGSLKTILALTDEPLVSTDFSQNSNSVIIDQQLTTVTGRLGKIFGWYDNEWAYSCRLKDILAAL